MCSKPKLVLRNLLKKKSGFYEARDLGELALVLSNRFRGSTSDWRALLNKSVRLRVPNIQSEEGDFFVPVFIRRDGRKVLGYVTRATLAAHPQEYEQLNKTARKPVATVAA